MLQNVQNAMVHAQPMLLGEPYVGLAAAIYVLFVLEVGGDVMSLGEPYAKGSLRRARSFLSGRAAWIARSSSAWRPRLSRRMHGSRVTSHRQ